jgi:peptide/nickel transport system substrate-binding protein
MASRTRWTGRRLAGVAGAAALVLVASQLGVPSASGQGSSAPFVDTGTITFAVTSDPAGLDPGVNIGQGPAMRAMVSMYEGLLRYEGTTTKLSPALAESWKVAPDGASIELRLRSGVKFHDGTTLDADTVKQSIDRTKAMNRAGAFYLQTLKEVQVVNPTTVRLVGTRPSVFLLYGLPNVYISGKAHLADPDRGAAFFQANGNGTGPYKLGRWDRGQQVVLEKFDDYWGGWAGRHVSKVIERIVPEPGTQQLLMERGDVHLGALGALGLTQDPKQLASKPGLKLVVTPSLRMTVISLNSRKGPTKDVRVRRALQLATDYEGMKRVYQGYGEIANYPLPKGFTDAYDPSGPPFKQDLAAAKKLLAEAGYPTGGFTLSLYYIEREEQTRLAALLLQQQLQKLGVTLKVEGKPFGTLIGLMADLETAAHIQVLLTQSPRSADAGEILGTNYGSGNAGKQYNWGWYANPEVDRLLADADRTFNDAERARKQRAAAKIIMDDAASIWPVYPTLVEVMRDEVQGYTYNPLQGTAVFSFYPIWLKK